MRLIASSRWWERWKLHRSYDASAGAGFLSSGRQSYAPEPGAIDNEPLLVKGDLAERRELKENLEEGVHFIILSRPAWNHLSAKWVSRRSLAFGHCTSSLLAVLLLCSLHWCRILSGTSGRMKIWFAPALSCLEEEELCVLQGTTAGQVSCDSAVQSAVAMR